MPLPALALGLAALFGAAAQVLFFGHGPGLNVPIAVALFLALAWALRPGAVAVDRRDLWIPAGAVLFAAYCAVRADVALLAVDVVAALALSLASVVVLGGVRVADLPAAGVVAEALRAVGSVLVRGAAVVAAAWPHVSALLGARLARAAGYAGGLLLALPFLLLFSSLFASADAVFARSLADLFDLRRWLDALGELPGRLALAAAAGWLAAGAFARLRAGAPPRATARRGWLAPEPATVALVAIDLLFGAFVALQLAYLFGGRDTVEAASISYSAYARRGFFELIAVATLVAVLLFGAELAVRRRGRPYLAAALALLGLTAIVLLSAAYRLDLYQRAFGWTEQRVYALAAIAFLAAALGILAWSVTRARMRFAVQPLAIAGLAVAAVVNAIAPSEYVVRANVARALDPGSLPEDAQRRLDACYLASLGDGAVPVLIELLPTLPEQDRRELATALRRRFDPRARPPQPWQSWNLDRERSRRALAESRDGLMRYPDR